MIKIPFFGGWWGVAIGENQLKIFNELEQQPGVCQWNRTQLDLRLALIRNFLLRNFGPFSKKNRET